MTRIEDEITGHRRIITLNLGNARSVKRIVRHEARTYIGKISQLEKIHGQKKLATMLNVNPRTIRKWKSRENKPKIGNIRKITTQYATIKEKHIYEGIFIRKEDLQKAILENALEYGFDKKFLQVNSEYDNFGQQLFIVSILFNKGQQLSARIKKHGKYFLASYVMKYHSFEDMVNMEIPALDKKLSNSPVTGIRLFRFGVIFYASSKTYSKR
jgi:transcriptional regulator with XRE-family HTH domain